MSVNRDSAVFCEKCGTRLVPQQTPEAPHEQTSHSEVSNIPRPLEPPSQAQPAISQPPKTPKTGAAIGCGSWLIYLLAVFGISLLAYAAIPVNIMNAIFNPYGDHRPDFYGNLVFFFVILLPIFLWLTWRRIYFGIVNHLQGAPNLGTPSTQSSAFELQQTNREWQPLKDSRGYLKPQIQIVYRSNKLHGEPLEEGHHVVVKGRHTRSGFKLNRVWNLGSSNDWEGDAFSKVYWGRVTTLGYPTSKPDMRHMGEGRILELWSFRLQNTDPSFNTLLRNASGDLMDPIPVEIKAVSISGPINEGDRVEIHGRMLNNILVVKRMINHSAGQAIINIREPVFDS